MKYLALFRGINVGGRNIVKMADLKKMFTDSGFEGVSSYIQSGNIIFEAGGAPGEIAGAIHTAFKNRFGFESSVTLRTGEEIAAIISELPFSADEIAAAESANPDVEHLYVYLPDTAPEQSEIERLTAGYSGPDKLRATHREIYLLCHQSIRDSKPAALLSKLNIPMTARNWKTITSSPRCLAGVNNDKTRRCAGHLGGP